MNVDLTERLSEDLAAIARDADALFHGKSNDLAERAREIRERLAEALDKTDQTINELNGAPSALAGVDDFIREKPYQALAISLGVGVAIGWLLNRK